MFYMGVDLGQRRDFTAMAIVERREDLAVQSGGVGAGAGFGRTGGAASGADAAGDAVYGGGSASGGFGATCGCWAARWR